MAQGNEFRARRGSDDQDGSPERYGSPAHEAWLIECEAQEEGWTDAQPFDVGGCGCVISQVYGGDCKHTAGDE